MNNRLQLYSEPWQRKCRKNALLRKLEMPNGWWHQKTAILKIKFYIVNINYPYPNRVSKKVFRYDKSYKVKQTYKCDELTVLTPFWIVILYVLSHKSCKNSSNALAANHGHQTKMLVETREHMHDARYKEFLQKQTKRTRAWKCIKKYRVTLGSPISTCNVPILMNQLVQISTCN